METIVGGVRRARPAFPAIFASCARARAGPRRSDRVYTPAAVTSARLAAPRLTATPLPPAVVIGAAFITAALVGVGLAIEVPIGLAILTAALYGLLVLFAPRLSLALFIPLVFLEAMPAFNAGGKAAGLLVAAAWVGMLLTGELRAAEVFRRHRRLFEAVVVLLVWLCISVLFAQDPAIAIGDLWHWFAVALLFVIVATTATDRNTLRLVLTAFVVGAVLSVVVGTLTGMMNTSPEAVEDTARLEGATGDPNFLAAGVVSALVLAAGLLVTARGALARLALTVSLVVMAGGLVASQSRGGFVAVLVVLGAAMLVFKRRRAYVALMALILVGAAAVFFSATPHALDRITSATDGGSGREGLWTVAWRAFQDYPVTGVGLNNYPLVTADYTRQPGQLERVQKIVERPTVVHNLYLQVLVETGLIGFALFMFIVLAALRAAWRASRLAERRGDEELEALARAVFVAMIGMLAASFFISDQVDRRLWLVLALGPAVLTVVVRRARSGPVAQRAS
jgi:O-antigen ligase